MKIAVPTWAGRLHGERISKRSDPSSVVERVVDTSAENSSFRKRPDAEVPRSFRTTGLRSGERLDRGAGSVVVAARQLAVDVEAPAPCSARRCAADLDFALWQALDREIALESVSSLRPTVLRSGRQQEELLRPASSAHGRQIWCSMRSSRPEGTCGHPRRRLERGAKLPLRG